MYIKDDNGNPIPYSFAQLRADNRNVSFPREVTDEWLESYGIYPVADAGGPDVAEGERVVVGPITLIDGVWTQTYSVELIPPLTAEQIEAIKDALIARFDQPTSIDKVMLKISFLQENRIRALEGKQPITAQQFKDWVRGQID